MDKYQKGDCRAKGRPDGTVSQVRFLGKKQGYPEPANGKNREMRRTDHHFRGIRMNTTGVPLGFNHVTWGEHCADSGNPGRRPNDTPFKGKPGTKILRKMFRKFGAREVLHAMSGAEREQRKHPGFARMGAYTKHGHKICKPRTVAEK